MRRSFMVASLIVSHAFAGVLDAQASVALTTPEREFAEPLSSIASIRELRDGRVIVVDNREYVVKLVDFTRTEASPVGRKGAGPGEYRSPLNVFPLPGDSSMVFDGGQTRLLLIGPDGRPGNFISTAGLSTAAENMVTRFVPTRSDALGRLYATGVPFRVTPQGPQAADSIPIVRWTRGDPETETMAWLRNRSLRDRGGDIDPIVAMFSSVVPFIVTDQWAVDRDGRIAILRYDNYRVDFVEPSGRRTTGSPIPFTPIRVSERHKETWRDQERLRVAGSPGGFKEPARWPDYLPPFLNRPAMFAVDGMLWVLRTGAADAPPLYDVIDKSGRLTNRVTLAPRSRIIGFSEKWVYVVRRDQDDLEYLQRFSNPLL